ncbi:MAG: C-GCAxxG-C-C family protein [Phycisphaerae bacterium]|jgi:C_GCAxxG_C_C family probable redox protein|nr:C-GCAxxG-C-C family protein [Phycisphaerae bacterium]
MSALSDMATEKFVSGYNCAQAVVWPFCDEINLDSFTARNIACGFGAGISKRQETCGAVTGGIMVLGMLLGTRGAHDRSTTEETYAMSDEFISRFEEAHGSCNCRELLGGCDLNTEEGREQMKELDLRNKTCKVCVNSAVEILEQIISNLPEKSIDESDLAE